MNQRPVLVPLDGSPYAEAALPCAVTLAQASGSGIRPLSVVEVLAGGAYADRLAALVGDGLRAYRQRAAARLDEEAAQAAAAYLEAPRAQAPAGVAVAMQLLRGDPATCLIDEAEGAGVDLVVMTSHGRGGLRRLVLGSVADRLVRRGLPTCIVHPTAVEREAEVRAAPQPAAVPARHDAAEQDDKETQMTTSTPVLERVRQRLRALYEQMPADEQRALDQLLSTVWPTRPLHLPEHERTPNHDPCTPPTTTAVERDT